MNLETLLQRKFGYTAFRNGQKEIIEDVINGQDVFALMPTGSGKSLLYLLPGYVKEGIVLIVSPLLSLMEDQVKQLKSKGEKRVVAINSFLKYETKQQILNNLSQYKFIFASPEILQNEFVLSRFKKQNIALFVIDEAHCISQWGHDFRTDYLKLGEVRKQIGDPTCLALTATAQKEIIKDIEQQLHMKNMKAHLHSIDRENICLAVRKKNSEVEKRDDLVELVKNLQGPGVIYFSSRSLTEEMSELLRHHTDLRIHAYHGGMDGEDRILIQQQFMENQLDVICCTSAFGMGVNKENIRYVIHYHFPSQIEAYNQEIGRAGRDGGKSVAILLYSPVDHDIPSFLIQQEFPDEKTLPLIWDQIKQLKSSGGTMNSEWERDVCHTLQLSETAWRFIKFHLERFNVIEGEEVIHLENEENANSFLLKEIEVRKKVKFKKLNEMVKFLETKQCLRSKMLAFFDQERLKKPHNCCSNCGFNTEDYYGVNELQIYKSEVFNWKEELEKIFNQRV
jgi:ATP-dependent DNA helicase RecQ